MKALVLGIGNILLSDEGVGVRAINELEKRFRFPEAVELVDGGTAGLELLSYLTDKKHLIVVDAMQKDHPPGTVMRVAGEDVPAAFMASISPHQLGLANLLATARIIGEVPENLVLFGIVPKTMDPGLELSQEVEKGLDKVLEAVVDELKQLGYAIEVLPKNNPIF